jgi:glycosyltransferase involved in cell wall biosynthesis
MSNIGAAPEIVQHGKDGFLCDTPEDFVKAINDVEKLSARDTYAGNKKRWSIETVCQNYIPLYQEVANGLRWK